MPDPEIDAEDGEVRETPPVAEDKRDEKRKPPTEDQSDRGSSKRHKSDRDRSRERGRVDRERDRDKRISYDQVSYSGDSYDKYDRYAAATADARDFGKSRRGKDGEKDEKSRRGYEYEKDLEAKDREKKKERDEHDKERERRKEKDEKESERRKDRDEDVGDKDRRKERDRGREKERSRSRDRSRMDKDSSKKGDDPGKERDRRDDRGEQRRRSRSRDRNRGKEGSDRHDDRKKDKDRHDRDRDAHSKSGPGEAKTRNSYDKEEIMLQDDEEDLEAIRKKRAAILEKIKNKSAANGSQPNGNQPGTISRNQSMEDIFEDQKSEPQKSDDQKVQDSGGNKSTQAEAEDVEDKDEIDTATVFAAKEHAGAESDEDGQDDMFTNSPARGKTGGAAKAVQRQKDGEEMDRSGLEEDRVDRRLGDTNADNWDDSEGYFRTRPGELIIGRYLVNRDIGNGVYSTVLSAADQQTSREVAIKVVRSNETMTTAGKKEIEILKKLGAEDPEGRRHICKLLSHFEYKNHLCMVFVPLEMNLRKLLKTYGREVGITLSAIRQYTRQLMIGLQHMVKCKVVHGDIKLDNIVITKDLKNVAICDFGTADWESECVITPYMVSRYYRPPEICLGLRYGYAMDLWSVGVCLFELYTGKFMFTGRNNNDMLKQFLDYKGAPNKKFLKRGQFFDQHFEEEKGQVVFKWLTQDKVTKAEIIEKKIYDKPIRSIYEQLRKVRSSSDDAKKIKEFADLLEQIFILDPAKRITVNEALKHPFLH